jgi:hypothetical protein
MIDLDSIRRALTTDYQSLWKENERLRAVLLWYAESYCSEGFNADCCGKLSEDDCRGCRARTALGEKTDV